MTLPALTPNLDHLATWLHPLLRHCDDRRNAQTLTGVVGGILGSDGLICVRIAAFLHCWLPAVMPTDGCGVSGVVLDGSDLRKPHAQRMEALQQAKALQGCTLAPGYASLTMLGLGGDGRRGILDHRLYSAKAQDFVSVPQLTRQMLQQVGASLKDWSQPVTLILDRGFDDQAILATGWRQGWHLVWRVAHRDRQVRAGHGGPLLLLAAVAARDLQAMGALEAELLVQKTCQSRPKRQSSTCRSRAS